MKSRGIKLIKLIIYSKSKTPLLIYFNYDIWQTLINKSFIVTKSFEYDYFLLVLNVQIKTPYTLLFDYKH